MRTHQGSKQSSRTLQVMPSLRNASKGRYPQHLYFIDSIHLHPSTSPKQVEVVLPPFSLEMKVTKDLFAGKWNVYIVLIFSPAHTWHSIAEHRVWHMCVW